MAPNDRHKTDSGQYPDPALVLAIRSEMESALHPVREQLGVISERLARGDTALALLHQRVESQEKRCNQHQTTQQQAALQPKTEKTKKEMHPLAAAALQTAINVAVTCAVLWFLVGIGKQAAQTAGAP